MNRINFVSSQTHQPIQETASAIIMNTLRSDLHPIQREVYMAMAGMVQNSTIPNWNNNYFNEFSNSAFIVFEWNHLFANKPITQEAVEGCVVNVLKWYEGYLIANYFPEYQQQFRPEGVQYVNENCNSYVSRIEKYRNDIINRNYQAQNRMGNALNNVGANNFSGRMNVNPTNTALTGGNAVNMEISSRNATGNTFFNQNESSNNHITRSLEANRRRRLAEDADNYVGNTAVNNPAPVKTNAIVNTSGVNGLGYYDPSEDFDEPIVDQSNHAQSLSNVQLGGFDDLVDVVGVNTADMYDPSLDPEVNASLVNAGGITPLTEEMMEEPIIKPTEAPEETTGSLSDFLYRENAKQPAGGLMMRENDEYVDGFLDDLERARQALKVKQTESPLVEKEETITKDQAIANILYRDVKGKESFTPNRSAPIWVAADVSEVKTEVGVKENGEMDLIFTDLSEEEKMEYEKHRVPNTEVKLDVIGKTMAFNREKGEMVEVMDVVDMVAKDKEELAAQVNKMEKEIPLWEMTEDEIIGDSQSDLVLNVLEIANGKAKEKFQTKTWNAFLAQSTCGFKTYANDKDIDVQSIVNKCGNMNQLREALYNLSKQGEPRLARDISSIVDRDYNRLLVKLGITNVTVTQAIDNHKDVEDNEIKENNLTVIYNAKVREMIKDLLGVHISSDGDTETPMLIINRSHDIMYLNAQLHEMNLTSPESSKGIAPHGWFEVVEDKHYTMYALFKGVLNRNSNNTNNMLITKDGYALEFTGSFDANTGRVFVRILK